MRFTAFAVLGSFLLSSSLSAQIVSTVAGNPVPGRHDGVGTEAQFNRPTWLDVDRSSGAIFVVDRANNLLRKITGGAVSTVPVAAPYWADPPLPIEFNFGGPYGGGIAVEPQTAGCGEDAYGPGIFLSSSGDNQLVLIAERDSMAQLAHRDDAPATIGTGQAMAVDGDAYWASFSNPGAMALSWNYGGGSLTYEVDKLYIADTGNHTIRRIRYRLSFESCPQPYYVETFAGAGGQSGSNDGSAMTARFNAPRGIASAPDGSVYVADTGNHTIRRIAPDGTVTTVAGHAGVAGHRDGVAHDALLNSPSGLDINALGEVFIADTGNFVVRKLTADGRLITIAGTPGVAGYSDGPASAARFSGPVGLRLFGNALYIADTANNVIRKLDFAPAEPRRRATRH